MKKRDASNGTSRPKVIIVGGGFGGLYAAKALAKSAVDITLVDKRNHHLFQPLLYQVATAGLNPGDIAVPIRSVLSKQKNVRVLLGEVTDVDVDGRRVFLGDEELAYDYLIVATGATHSYFGNGEWETHAPGLKTVEDALRIRRKVLWAYEMAEREEDEERRRAWMTFAIVGAGPTGVELAGALAEIASKTLAGNFRHIDPSEARVLLVEGQERVLASYSESSSTKAGAQLEELGVELRLGARVTAINGEGLQVGDEWIPCKSTLWAAGVAASPLGEALRCPLDSQGRVLVEEDLSVPEHPEVFVVGDLAHVPWEEGTVPGVAPAAVQGARHVARTILEELGGSSERTAFRYRDKGSLATIGRAAAVAEIGRMKWAGFWAWMVWWAVHIYFLIGFRSRLMVMLGWVWSYLSFQRGARLITGSSESAAPERLQERDQAA